MSHLIYPLSRVVTVFLMSLHLNVFQCSYGFSSLSLEPFYNASHTFYSYTVMEQPLRLYKKRPPRLGLVFITYESTESTPKPDPDVPDCCFIPFVACCWNVHWKSALAICTKRVAFSPTKSSAFIIQLKD